MVRGEATRFVEIYELGMSLLGAEIERLRGGHFPGEVLHVARHVRLPCRGDEERYSPSGALSLDEASFEAAESSHPFLGGWAGKPATADFIRTTCPRVALAKEDRPSTLCSPRLCSLWSRELSVREDVLLVGAFLASTLLVTSGRGGSRLGLASRATCVRPFRPTRRFPNFLVRLTAAGAQFLSEILEA